MTTPIFIHGLSAIASRYDGFLLDIWGVLHHGAGPLPGVLECLGELRRAQKKLWLISNSPRRLGSVNGKLSGMGFDMDVFSGVMTSGEMTHQALQNRPDDFHRALGHRVYHLGPERDRDSFTGLGLTEVKSPREASFILNTGIYDMRDTLAPYEPTIAEGIAHRLPMLCANPDLLVPFEDGFAICAGEIARTYEERGGRVAYHGKPYPQIYQACLDGLQLPRERVAAIGDNLATDIKGAKGAGLDAILVAGGIHRRDFGIAWGELPDADTIAPVLAGAPALPDAIVPSLRW